MRMRLKKLSDQVIVITGATSGIGLVTARMAAARGARLVLAARNEDALRTLSEELTAAGSHVLQVAADVRLENDVRRIADEAIARFGGFDTWVNNAGVGMFSRIEETIPEDRQSVVDTNFWGVVHGCMAALPQLKSHGGALINVGSGFGDRAAPLQGYYSAAKHAVKGYTDALRVELAEEKAPVSVTLIQPSSIDTMFPVHAKNYLDKVPKLPPPQYAPETVAEAILYAAEHEKREIYVGAAARFLESAQHYAPRLVDKIMALTMFSLQKTDQPSRDRSRHNLDGPMDDLQERTGRTLYVQESSWYTNAITHPRSITALAVGAGLALGWMWRSRGRR